MGKLPPMICGACNRHFGGANAAEEIAVHMAIEHAENVEASPHIQPDNSEGQQFAPESGHSSKEVNKIQPDSEILKYLTSYEATNKEHAEKLIAAHDNALLDRPQPDSGELLALLKQRHPPDYPVQDLKLLAYEIQALITASNNKLLDRIEGLVPEKISKCSDDCRYGKNCKQVLTHNATIDKFNDILREVRSDGQK